MKIVLHGEKINGAFALVKIKGKEDNAWLLIKKQDDEATEKDITKKDRSVKTARTLLQIAKETGGKPKTKSKSKPVKKKSLKE